MEANCRTQAERAAGTREALTAAARQLFAAHGFTDVALETIVRAAVVTGAALYHHFADKTELFAAVFEQVEGDGPRSETATSSASSSASSFANPWR